MERCLSSITQAPIPVGHEILVVNDGSTDRTEEIVKKFPCQHIKIEQSGVARARNVGIAHAAGEILLFFDADTKLAENTITRFLEAFNNDRKMYIAQGRWAPDYPEANFNTLFHLNKWSYNFKELLAGEERVAVSELMTGCLGVRKEVFEKIGGFDENYKRSGGEEWELGFRMTRNNYQIYYYNDIAVYHDFGSFWSTFYKTYFRTINFAILIFHAQNEKEVMFDGVKNSVPNRDKLSTMFVSLMNLAMLYGLCFLLPLDLRANPAHHMQAAGLAWLFFCGLYLHNIKGFLCYLYEREGGLFVLQAILADFLIILQKIRGTLNAIFIYYILGRKNFKI